MEEDWGIGRIWGKPESEKRMSRMCSGVRLGWGLNLARNYWKGVQEQANPPSQKDHYCRGRMADDGDARTASGGLKKCAISALAK